LSAKGCGTYDRHVRSRNHNPGACLPLGSELSESRQTARMTMRPLDFLEELREELGDVFTLRLANEPPWVIVSDPGLMAKVFRAPSAVLHAGEGKHVLQPILGDNSLLLLDEDPHREQRKLMHPPFKGANVERYEEAMRTAAERAIEDWPLGKTEPSATWTRRIAVEVILHAVFGAGGSDHLGALRDALENLYLPGNARESEAPNFREVLARVDELIYAEIADRAERASEEADNVLSLLLQARHEDGSPMSSVEIRDELVSLLEAGHETTATALAWALEYLARSPEALALTTEEASEGGGPYTDAVIRETLRLRPPVPLVPRAVVEPFELGRYLIPPGTTIMPAVLLLHHRPDIYPDPTCFRPERFLERPPDPNTWMPFGGGVRRCIGARFALLEMRVVLATLLAHVGIRAANSERAAMRMRDVTLTPSRGAPLILESRSPGETAHSTVDSAPLE
jgi:cytochrome P450 family 135